MMRFLLILIAMFLGTGFPGPQLAFAGVPAQEVQSKIEIHPYMGGVARQELELFTSELSTLQAVFEQKIISSDGFIEDESSGEVWLRKDAIVDGEGVLMSQFRWSYEGEFPELIVADGIKVWMYDESLEQVTVRDQSGAAADNPLALLTDITRIDEQFEVRELGDVDGLQLLELRSRSEESEFERVLLGLAEGRLDMLAMEDAFGLRTEIRFYRLQRNPVLNDELFEFTAPEGTDVIGSLEFTGPDG